MVFKSELGVINKKIAMCRSLNSKIYSTGKLCFKLTQTLDQIVQEKNYIKKKINEYFADVSNVQKSSQSTGVVFATFKDSQDYETFFNFFPQTAYSNFFFKIVFFFANYLFPCCFNDRYKRKINIINQLKVVRAPEPTDILWQNLEYSDLNKIVRKLLVYVISIVLILISFTLIVILNIIQNKYKTEFDALINSIISLAISSVIIVINFILNVTLRKLSEY
jgi:hypothetical protein